MAWIPLAAAAVSAGAGYLGGEKQKKAAKEAQKIRDKAAEQIYGLEVPDVNDLAYTNDKYTYEGDTDPTLLSNLGDVQSEFGNISADPRFQTAQYQSLGALDDVIAGGGQTAADKLAFEKSLGDASAQSYRDQGAITRDLAERGMGGSGQELAMRLASSQNAANNNAGAAAQMSANAQQRALDAIMQRGNLAGNMQGAAYDQQNQAAQAKDMIARFNKENAYQTQTQNANISNGSQERNLNARQGLNNSNVGLGNQDKATRAAAVQQTYGNQMDKAVAGSNAATGQANSRVAAGNAAAAQAAGIATAVPGIVTAGTNAYNAYTAPSASKPILTDDPTKKPGSAWS